MSTRRTLFARLLLGSLVPTIVFTLAALGVYVQTVQLGQTMADVQRASEIVERAARLQRDVLDLQRVARGAMLSPTAFQWSSYQEARDLVDLELAELRGLVRDADQIVTLGRMTELTEMIGEGTRQQLDLVKGGQASEAIKLFQQGQSEQQYRAFRSLQQQFYERERQIFDGQRAQAGNQLVRVKQLALGGLLIALVLSLGMGVWLARQTRRSLQELVAVLAASAHQIAATTEEHEGAMTQQATAVTQATATVEEMVATARVNAEQAELATQSANGAQATTREGLELVTHNSGHMAEMEDSMNSIARKIIGLSEQAGQIGEIARVVGELAAETNMLALNAAVEAARAGEQGKGFAVVASEVRKLADQSKKSAERANQIVSEIQKATNGMVMTAEDGSKRTHAAAESSRLAAQAFEKVIHLADAVVENARQVLLNSKEQAVALAQIDIAMKNINHGTREMTMGTGQIREGMTRLSGVANELNKML